jgi:hypothetical protein
MPGKNKVVPADLEAEEEDDDVDYVVRFLDNFECSYFSFLYV